VVQLIIPSPIYAHTADIYGVSCIIMKKESLGNIRFARCIYSTEISSALRNCGAMRSGLSSRLLKLAVDVSFYLLVLLTFRVSILDTIILDA
jgi:hypothetical protein